MKKRNVFILVLIACLLFTSVSYAICDNHPYASVYTKRYNSYATYNATYHIKYRIAEVFCSICNEYAGTGGDIESEEYAPHSFSNNKCTLCGYRRAGNGNQSNLPTAEDLQREALQRIAEDPEDIINKRAIIVHSGNLRESPDKYANIIGSVYTEEEYTIVSYQITRDGTVWLEVQYGYFTTAWLSASLAEISGANTASGERALYINRTCQIKVSSGKARMSPGTNSPVIEYVHRGEKYTILDCQSAPDGTLWFQINVGRTKCWISSGLADVW